jgi:thioredoxin-related protein
VPGQGTEREQTAFTHQAKERVMRHSRWVHIVAIVVCVAGTALAVESMTKGAKAGVWSQDLAAAKKLAARKKLPILLNFSGSDWCGWCKLMEKNVFSKKAWGDFAKKGLVMVLIDFPRDGSLVPAKYQKRNKELQTEYEVRGFPTYVVLDDDGETVLGTLSAGQEKTPEIFQAELEVLCRYRQAQMEKYLKKIPLRRAAKYRAIVKDMKAAQKQMQIHKKGLKEAEAKVEELTKAALEFRISELGGKEQAAYWKTKAELATAEKELETFIGSNPDVTEANQRKAMSLARKVRALQAKLESY